jgi:hypothetical protein
MPQNREQTGRWACLCLGALLLSAWTGGGCALPLYSIHPVPPDLAETCDCIALSGRNHVYTFFVQGADPLDFANLEGVKEYVQALGFHKTWFGHCYHVPHFAELIVQISQCDPDARFVIVSMVHGVDAGRKLAYTVGERNVGIDLLVLLDGNLPRVADDSRPPHVRRVLTIVAVNCKEKYRSAVNADGTHEVESGPLGVPTDSGTLQVLARELATLAGSIEVVEDVPVQISRPIYPDPSSVVADPVPEKERDEWDFLLPAAAESRQPSPINKPPTLPAPPKSTPVAQKPRP